VSRRPPKPPSARPHGRQSRARDRCDFSTDALADDLQAVLDAALPDGRRAVLVGHSLGAMSIVEHIELERVAHMAPLEAPHEVNAAIERLATRVHEPAVA
jgi:surfactin synthase thioesterase subunit